MPKIAIRPATIADLPAIHPVIERAYRGDSARAGWTHEADLVEGTRTDLATLTGIVENPRAALLMAADGETPIGSVQVEDRGGGLAYFGLLCVDPLLQAGGTGSLLIDAADAFVRQHFGARTMEMTVVDVRTELVAYYERRGYKLTGEIRPFPVETTPPLRLAVMAKPLR